MDDEKKEVETVEEKQETEPTESETVEAETTTEETKEAEPDYKSMYEKLMKEHEDLQAKYKERFSETADLSEQAQTAADLSESIDQGDEDTIAGLFAESGTRTGEGLRNYMINKGSAIGGELGKFGSDIVGSVGKLTGSEALKDAADLNKNPIGSSKYSIKDRGLSGAVESLTGETYDDLFENVAKGITTAERNRNF